MFLLLEIDISLYFYFVLQDCSHIIKFTQNWLYISITRNGKMMAVRKLLLTHFILSDCLKCFFILSTEYTYRNMDLNKVNFCLSFLCFYVANSPVRFRFYQKYSDVQWAIDNFYLGPGCLDNCRGHGDCLKEQCICDPGHSGPNCYLTHMLKVIIKPGIEAPCTCIAGHALRTNKCETSNL